MKIVGPLGGEMMEPPSARLHLIGYWWSSDAPDLPHPGDHCDTEWGGWDRALVARYLRIAPVIQRYFGVSQCRFRCGEKKMGSAERSDGVWAWPEGLAHYVERHAVHLPDEFLDHARSANFDPSSFRFRYLSDPQPILSLEKWLAWAGQWTYSVRQEANRMAAVAMAKAAQRKVSEDATKAEHFESHHGVSEQRCGWHECSRRAIVDFAYCGDCAVRLRAYPYAS